MSESYDLDGEVVAEEEAMDGPSSEVRAIEPRPEPPLPALRDEVRTAALAAAGGALAGAVAVAAVRAVGSRGSRRRPARPLARRRDRPANVVASRSFLVDVHLLGR